MISHGTDKENEISKGLVGLSKDYCRTLSAALFNGDEKAVDFHTFSKQDAFDALKDGIVDVLTGGRVEKKYDLGAPGIQYSTPYYYGNETAREDVSLFALATREEDMLFSSFVNVVVVATIYAQEREITTNTGMPIMSIFGSQFSWALRHAFSFSGSYDEMYEKNFPSISEADRGRNVLNSDGPQLHSFPGLSPMSDD